MTREEAIAISERWDASVAYWGPIDIEGAGLNYSVNYGGDLWTDPSGLVFGKTLWQALIKADARVKELELAVNEACLELVVRGPAYPVPVPNAYEILVRTRGKHE